MTNSEQLAALFRIAAVRRFVRNAGGVAWPGRFARFMTGLVLAWGLWAPHVLSAARRAASRLAFEVSMSTR